MNKEEYDGTGNFPTENPEMELFLDSEIFRMLGLRFEIQADIVKLWERDVVPDETNWLIGTRFTQSVPECVRMIEHLGCTMTFGTEQDWHWAVVHLGDEAEIETDEFREQRIAAAAAVYLLLLGMKNVSKD